MNEGRTDLWMDGGALAGDTENILHRSMTWSEEMNCVRVWRRMGLEKMMIEEKIHSELVWVWIERKGQIERERENNIIVGFYYNRKMGIEYDDRGRRIEPQLEEEETMEWHRKTITCLRLECPN